MRLRCFSLVHVAIETQAHPPLLVLNQGYGADILATFKGDLDCMELCGTTNLAVTVGLLLLKNLI